MYLYLFFILDDYNLIVQTAGLISIPQYYLSPASYIFI